MRERGPTGPSSIDRISYWLEEETNELAVGDVRGRVDVAVVGGGVTGCACAYALASAGVRVRVHEARRIASGASGRNGGFALRGGAMPYDVARRQLGAERARALWNLSARSLDLLERLAGDAFARVGSLRVAADPAERRELESEYEALCADGLAAEWREELAAPLAGRFDGAIFHPPDGSIQPARWVRRLANLAASAGAVICEESRVEDLDDLEADRIVVALDGVTAALVPELEGVVRPVRGQVLVTEPLPERLFGCPHYARRGYDYWQQTDEGRLVLGGRRDRALDDEFTALEETSDAVQGELESFARELLGKLPRVTHRWAGIWGLTPDRLPLAGRLPRRAQVWIAGGYSGHGNVLGLACGDLVARALLGDSPPELELFDPARFR